MKREPSSARSALDVLEPTGFRNPRHGRLGSLRYEVRLSGKPLALAILIRLDNCRKDRSVLGDLEIEHPDRNEVGAICKSVLEARFRRDRSGGEHLAEGLLLPTVPRRLTGLALRRGRQFRSNRQCIAGHMSKLSDVGDMKQA